MSAETQGGHGQPIMSTKSPSHGKLRDSASPLTASNYRNQTPLLICVILVFAVAIRLWFFTGMGVGDDVIYLSQILAHVESGHWPPLAYHWSTRLGLTLPTVLVVKVFGLHPIAFVLLPLLASVLKIYIAYRVVLHLLDSEHALLVAAILAVYPLDVLYATSLYPDTLVGTLSTIALLLWISALKGDSACSYALCGLFLGGSYLCHETVAMQAPIYFALWLVLSRRLNINLAWVLVAPVTVLGLESALYAITADDPLYRIHSILAQQSKPENLKVILGDGSSVHFWTEPLVMVITNHEYWVWMLLALVLAVAALRGKNRLEVFAIWVLVGFLWSYFGTTTPTDWVPLARDPRYSLYLTVPSAVLIAHALIRWRLSPPTKRLMVGALLGGSALCGYLEQGGLALEPHRQFLNSEYASQSTLDPYNHLLARWQLGLRESTDFGFSHELGQDGMTSHLELSPISKNRPLAQTRYVVISPQINSQSFQQLIDDGYQVVDDLPGRGNLFRQLISRVLITLDVQTERAKLLAQPPGLLVLSR